VSDLSIARLIVATLAAVLLCAVLYVGYRAVQHPPRSLWRGIGAAFVLLLLAIAVAVQWLVYLTLGQVSIPVDERFFFVILVAELWGVPILLACVQWRFEGRDSRAKSL
jgi:hypothetical protein